MFSGIIPRFVLIILLNSVLFGNKALKFAYYTAIEDFVGIRIFVL
jgi:hypothetical protein